MIICVFFSSRQDLAERPDYVRDVLRDGGTAARAKAEQFMEQVREHVGIVTTYQTTSMSS